MEEFMDVQPGSIRLEFLDALNLLASGKALSMPLSRNLSNIIPGLHELRLKDRAGQVRVMYFIKKQDAIYLIHAFRKKTQEFPKKEIELIKKRVKEL